MQVSSYVSDRQKKKKRRRRYFFIALAVIFVSLLIWGTHWLIVDSSLFRVDAVVVQGNASVTSSGVVALLQGSAPKEHGIFGTTLGFGNMLSWPDEITSDELLLSPQLASATVSKDYWSHTITINVTERAPFGIWCFMSGDQDTQGDSADCFWFDDTGTIFEKAFDTEGNLIFLVNDYSQKERGLNQKVLPDEFVGNFISILNVLHQAGLAVKEIDLKDLSLQEMDAQLADGPSIYFSLRFPADNDLPVIQSIMSQSGFDSLQYIDCRTQNRVYYK